MGPLASGERGPGASGPRLSSLLAGRGRGCWAAAPRDPRGEGTGHAVAPVQDTGNAADLDLSPMRRGRAALGTGAGCGAWGPPGCVWAGPWSAEPRPSCSEWDVLRGPSNRRSVANRDHGVTGRIVSPRRQCSPKSHTCEWGLFWEWGLCR